MNFLLIDTFGLIQVLPGTSTNLTELGVQMHTASQSQYTTFEKRLQTFRDWPKDVKQTPEMLAAAGFYYQGQRKDYLFFHIYACIPEHCDEMLIKILLYVWYTGFNDQVRCFHCDGGLHGWQPTDDVWVEHAYWFSHCGFVILMRGHKFIKQSKDTRESLNLSVTIMSFFPILSINLEIV